MIILFQLTYLKNRNYTQTLCTIITHHIIYSMNIMQMQVT